MTILWSLLPSLTILGFILWMIFNPLDIDNIFGKMFSYALMVGSIWMVILGAISLSNTDWFDISISNEGAISMVSIGSISLVGIIIWWLVVQMILDDFFEWVCDVFSSIGDWFRRKHYRRKYGEDYLDDDEESLENYDEQFHVVLSKTQNIDLDELELLLKSSLDDADCHKYKKGEIMNSFKENGYYIIESFDFEEDANEFKQALKSSGIKSTVYDDEWIASLDSEMEENPKMKDNIKLRFGDNEYKMN